MFKEKLTSAIHSMRYNPTFLSPLPNGFDGDTTGLGHLSNGKQPALAMPVESAL